MIRFSPVRVIGSDGQQVGVIPVDEARALARDQDLDLVEVAPESRPPVCKIMDYGRFTFERDRKARQARKNQQRIETKEVKFRPNIGDHDFTTKVRHAEAFLRNGQHVKLTVMFRRREMRRPELGFKLLERASERLAEVAKVESAPPQNLEGRDLSMVLKPDS